MDTYSYPHSTRIEETKLSDGTCNAIKQLKMHCKGLETIDLINAIKHTIRLMNMKDISTWSENFWRVHIFGPIMDNLLTGIKGVSLEREYRCIGTNTFKTKNKFLDFAAVSETHPKNLSSQISIINCEEKRSLEIANLSHNTGIREVKLSEYQNNNADRIKLGKLMRDELENRRPIDSKMTQFGIQWLGSHMYIFGMKLGYARYSVMVELASHDVANELYEAIISTLALRKLVEDEIEKELKQEKRASKKILMPSDNTPTKTSSQKKAEDKNKKTPNMSSNTQTNTTSHTKKNQTDIPSEYFLCGKDEVLRCPPDPTLHVPPYNFNGMYEIQKPLVVLPGYDLYPDIFLAKCKENGRTVVLKRLWEHVAHEQSEVKF